MDGNKASRKNGEANAVEKASMPTTGQNTCPFAAQAKIVPTNANVQVKETKVKVNAIKTTPMTPPVASRFEVQVSNEDGIWISNTPISMSANSRNNAAKNKLSHLLFESVFKLAGPKTAAVISPNTVNAAMILRL